MARSIDRKQYLKQNPLFARFIRYHQETSDFDTLIEIEDEKKKRAARKKLEKNYEPLPQGLAPLKDVGRLAFAISGGREMHYPTQLAKAVKRLCETLKISELTLVPRDRVGNWIGEEHEDSYVSKARETIRALRPKKGHVMALPVAEISSVVPALVILNWGSPEISEIFFCISGTAAALTLCQYGILHLETWDEVTERRFRKGLRKVGFREVERCSDYFYENLNLPYQRRFVLTEEKKTRKSIGRRSKARKQKKK